MWKLVLLLGGIILGATALAAADEAYRLAPQDKIAVTVLKHPELSQNYTIPPDGAIDVPRAGRIPVVGKTTDEVAGLIKTALEEILVNPEVTVTLAEVRLRQAYVLGAVAKPGQYPLTVGMRVTELLAAAGDLIGERARLTASLMRGKETLPVNLQGAIAGTVPEANLRIEEGDVLWVQAPTMITVIAAGQLKAPGAYQVYLGSTVADVLAKAGDAVGRPDRLRLSLERAGKVDPVDWKALDAPVQDGDRVIVDAEPLARIFVNGHVKNPGAYELPEGGGVLEALTLAGGVRERPMLSRVTIVRAKDGGTEQIDLGPALIRGIVASNPRLQPGDQVIVPESTAKISVWGQGVRQPGSFDINESQPPTVVQAISLAGGQEKRGELSKTMVFRSTATGLQRIPVDVLAILKNKAKPGANIVLQANDVVYVPENKRPSWDKILDSLYKIGIIIPVL